MRKSLIAILVIVSLTLSVRAQKSSAPGKKANSVFVDKQGIMRWKDGRELALFGANYSLPSSCDYRAAGYINADRKKMVDDDMAHFARMGWDAMRLCLWGDFENSDKEGNLIENDHLNIMDYAIFKAKERGIYILFTPITTYSSQFPDLMGDTNAPKGFSSFFKKSELGTNPEAIKAQVNYLKQILNHVNPYTGVALKDEPAILFVELINEPIHHPEDLQGSVNYINSLADAIKSTGCDKLLFHNVSQDMNIAKAIKLSKADGSSFAWYPMGLNSGRMLQENHLRAVDDFVPMHTPDLAGKPKMVYEFDEADGYSPYMYPAMVRSFKTVGAQFITMFSYDMLATAPYNLGWQTHLFNMVYYPQKGAAGIIAAEAMKQLPLYKNYGNYPQNTTFGPVSVSYDTNNSELVTKEKFMYANSTATMPTTAKSLTQIVGYGSSPLVSYPGKGIYFLDKVRNGVWRLEIYPDALIISNPFAQMSKDKVVSRLIYGEWPMEISIPDLGAAFSVSAVNAANSYSTKAIAGKFNIRPGVYILSVKDNPGILPATIGHVKFNEFICPKEEILPTNVLNQSSDEYQSGKQIALRADIIDAHTPDKVSLYCWSAKQGRGFRPIPMKNIGGYSYEAIIPADQVKKGMYKYIICVTQNGKTKTYPDMTDKTPADWDFSAKNPWEFLVVDSKDDLPLLNPDKDYQNISYTRIGDAGRMGQYSLIPVADLGHTAIRLFFPIKDNPTLEDYSMSVPVKNKILSRGESLLAASSIVFRLRGEQKGQKVFVTVMESDGTSWTKEIIVEKDWNTIKISLNDLQLGKGILLPLGFPGEWDYWVNPAEGRGKIGDKLQLNKVERVQVSFRPSGSSVEGDNPWLDLSAINITFN